VTSRMIDLKDIHKSFGKFEVLKGIDFYVEPGEIVALVGDNGAGKSTLIKIICGLYNKNKGKIWFEGKLVNWKSPKESRDAGVEVVYQDLALQELLSVTRNFFLGKELLKKYPLRLIRIMDVRKMDIECKKSLDSLGINIKSVEEMVETLSGGQRQSIAIARSLYYGKKILILDEPTAALSVKETKHVLELTKIAAKHGLGVIVISHNIMQVHSITDRIVVLFRGKIAINEFKNDISVEEVTNAILTGSKHGKIYNNGNQN